jgi:hypothetical protein
MSQATNPGSPLHVSSEDYGDNDKEEVIYRVDSNYSNNTDNNNNFDQISDKHNNYTHKIPKEDHRLQGFRAGDKSGSVSSRLNKHINKEGNTKQSTDPSEIEDLSLDDSDKLRNRNLRAQHRSKREAINSRDRERSDSNGIAINEDRSDSDSEDDNCFRNNQKDIESNTDGEVEKKVEEKAKITIANIPSKPTGVAPPPPTSAPPRRAKDALAEAENQKSRKSLDEFLFKKENKAEAKNNDKDSSEDENIDFKVSEDFSCWIILLFICFLSFLS